MDHGQRVYFTLKTAPAVAAHTVEGLQVMDAHRGHRDGVIGPVYINARRPVGNVGGLIV